MVNEADPIVNKFISVPREMGSLNCAAFVAGVIKGVLDGAGFVSAHSCCIWLEEPTANCSTLLPALLPALQPAKVNAHSVPSEGQPRRTTFLIKFDTEVLFLTRKLKFRLSLSRCHCVPNHVVLCAGTGAGKGAGGAVANWARVSRRIRAR